MSPASTPTHWQLSALHHIGLTVADLERSIHFYRDVLSLTLIRRRPRVDSEYVARQTGYPGVVLDVASFQISADTPQSLEIAQYLTQAGPPIATATNQAGASHLCLTVDDLRACHADLRAQGVRFKSEPVTITAGPNTGGLVVYFYDPDGHVLEFFQKPKEPAAAESEPQKQDRTQS